MYWTETVQQHRGSAEETNPYRGDQISESFSLQLLWLPPRRLLSRADSYLWSFDRVYHNNNNNYYNYYNNNNNYYNYYNNNNNYYNYYYSPSSSH